MGKVKQFIKKCKRVWQTLKKPSKKELQVTTKVSAIGILIIGAIGFLISIIVGLFQ